MMNYCDRYPLRLSFNEATKPTFITIRSRTEGPKCIISRLPVQLKYQNYVENIEKKPEKPEIWVA